MAPEVEIEPESDVGERAGLGKFQPLAPGVDGDYCRVGEERVVVEGERSGEGEPSEERNGEGEEGARC